MKVTRFRTAALGIALMMLSPRPGLARDVVDLIQPTCSKTLDYFDLKTVSIELNEEQEEEDQVKFTHLEKTNAFGAGFQSVTGLLKKPYTCELRTRTVVVKVVNYTGSRDHCPAMADYRLNISVNGVDVDTFSPYGYDRCSAFETHLISVDNFDHYRNCTLIDRRGMASECTRKMIK